MSKQYQVTEEIKDLFIEEMLLRDCRDSAMSKELPHEIVLKYSRLCLAKHKEAWSALRNYLPELDGKKNLSFNCESGEVTVNE